MRLLLDENLPKRLKNDYSDHEVYTTRERGWNGVKNGDLLNKLVKHNFDVLITFDKNLEYQQNFSKYPISVIILHAPINTYETLTKLTPKVLETLNRKLLPGPIEIS